jgi:hypothetical protein
VLTLVFRFGQTAPPGLNVMVQRSHVVDRLDSIHITGAVSGTYLLKVWLFVDDGTAGKAALKGQVRGTFRVDFMLASLRLSTGHHQFIIFAVDQLGGISQPSSWMILVVGPVMTPAPTRSIARQTRSPIPGFVIQYSTAVSEVNFDIFGMNDGVKVPTTAENTGYEILLSVGDKTGNLLNGRPQTISDITVSTLFVPHDRDMIKVIFNVMNEANEDRTVSLAVSATIAVGGSALTDLVLLDYMAGFQMQTPAYTYSFVGRFAPLVTDLDNFWFGRANRRRESLCDQVSASLPGQNRSAIAFSWRNKKIGTHQGVNYSAIFWFRDILARPTMSLSSNMQVSIYEPGLLTFNG